MVIGLLCLSLPDVFAVLMDGVLVIYVSRVVVTKSAVNLIRSTVGSEDRVIAETTKQIVLTETAIYAVVTVSATYHVEATAA